MQDFPSPKVRSLHLGIFLLVDHKSDFVQHSFSFSSSLPTLTRRTTSTRSCLASASRPRGYYPQMRGYRTDSIFTCEMFYLTKQLFFFTIRYIQIYPSYAYVTFLSHSHSKHHPVILTLPSEPQLDVVYLWTSLCERTLKVNLPNLNRARVSIFHFNSVIAVIANLLCRTQFSAC